MNVRSSINKFNSLTGKNLYGYSGWLAEWGGDFSWFMRSGDHSILPLLQDGTVKAVAVTWRPWQGSTSDQQTIKNIIAGLSDSYIRTQANICKSFGYPIYMRFGAEFDLNQGGLWATNPTNFINCWKHVVDIFRAQGANNVIWVWNPNYSECGALHPARDYYPGDNYVDWVGIDMYQSGDNVDPAQQMAPLYNEYGSRKPIGIFEWAVNSYPWTSVNTPDAKRAEYMNKFFDAVEARPNVKLVSYWYVWDAFKFNAVNTPLTAAKYTSRIASSMYIAP